MTELLTAAQMREIERAAIESGEVTGLELMERAGRGAVEAILAQWPELAEGERRAVVLCGPGNNGGDGFVVARLLRERGWAVEVFLHGDPGRLPPDARANWERWEQMGGVAGLGELIPKGKTTDLYIDALFGTGLTRKVESDALDRVAAEIGDRRDGPPYLVSLDIVSGLDADSGRPIGSAHSMAHAHLTVAFHSAKRGHYLDKGAISSGCLRAVDIGLGGTAERCGEASLRPEGSRTRLSTRRAPHARAPGDSVALVSHPVAPPHRLMKGQGHKYGHGHALILSGGVGRGGAARMAGRGALRIGAGLVTLACPPAAVIENAARLDAIMLRPVRDGEAFAALLEDGRLNALCLGPGLGTGEREAALVRVALGGPPQDPGAPGPTPGRDRPGAPRDAGDEGRAPHAEARGPASEAGVASGAGPGGTVPDAASPGGAAGTTGRPAAGAHLRSGSGAHRSRAVVLDGDALTILARDPDLFALLHDRCVLTPHGGEFARLFPDIAGRLDAPAETGPAYSKVDAAREAAARAGCVVVFKGPDTVIADPDGRAAINSAHYERSVPWLATAGAGDVLAGFVAGLLARGFAPMRAAEAAAWLHVECALEFGPGLIAEDLPEQLPAVLRRLGA